MDAGAELLERLDRVVALDRRRRAAGELDGVLRRELLGELRALVDEAGVAAAGAAPAGAAAAPASADGGEVVERPARRLQGT